MRIGIDIKALKHRPSGIQIYHVKLLDALQTIDTVNDYILYEQRPSTYRLFNPRWSRAVLPTRLSGTLWLQLLPPRIKKDNLDIFWGPEQVCPLWKMSNVKYITTILDYTFRHFPQTVRFTTRWILRLTWKRVFSVSDALIPISKTMYDETCSLQKEINRTSSRVEVISVGSPGWTPPEEYAAEKRGEHLLYIGNIEPRKNLLQLISALELLHSRTVTPKLKIISASTWLMSDFTRNLEASPIRNSIELCGFLSTDALKNELTTCKALVFPSIYEGFGIPVLEALSLDCLVLTSKGTAMEAVAEECACYFDPNSPESIASCIEKIYRPEFNREHYLQNRQTILARYTWKNSAEKLLSLFNSLCAVNDTAS